MLSRDHIIAGLASLCCMGTGVGVIACQTDGIAGEYLSPIAHRVCDAFLTFGRVPTPVVMAVGLSLFVFGTLLPDIDSETSLLGRYVHVPFEHRTWTHTVWFVIPLAMASMAVPILWWLTLGYAVHLFWDSLSRGGVCWFYPLSRYRTFDGGAKVKERHVLKLYGVGDASETVVVSGIVLCAVLLMWRYGPIAFGCR